MYLHIIYIIYMYMEEECSLNEHTEWSIPRKQYERNIYGLSLRNTIETF